MFVPFEERRGRSEVAQLPRATAAAQRKRERCDVFEPFLPYWDSLRSAGRVGKGEILLMSPPLGD